MWNYNTPVKDAALTYLEAGLAPIPLIPGEKRPPIEWAKYQQRPPKREEVEEWFSNGDVELGVLTGNASNGLLVLDADPRDPSTWQKDPRFLPQLLDEFFAAVKRICPSLEQKLRETLRARTPNGRHFWLRCPALPEWFTIAKLKFEHGEVELRGNKHIVVAPPSRGYEFENLNPNAPIEESIKVLTDEEGKALLAIFNAKPPKSSEPAKAFSSAPTHFDAQRLRRRKKQVTATGDLIALLALEHHLARKVEQAEPGSRNFTGYKLARQGRDLRLPKEIVLEGMQRYHKHVPPHYRNGKPDPYTWSEARRSTESAFKKAPGKPAIPPHIEALRDYGAMARRIVSKLHIPQTRGIRQSSIRSVLEPLIAIALSCGETQNDDSIKATITHFSYRYAELLTGLRKDTIAKVMNALGNGKLKGIQVKIIKPAIKTQLLSNVYQVTISAELLENETDENRTLSHSTHKWDSVLNSSVCHDAFQPGALGKESYFVLAALSEMGPATAAELAGRLDKTSDAVRAQLRKLEEFGLVRRLGKRSRAYVWAINGEIDKKLDEIAETRGTAYKGMERAAKHGEERRKFKKLLETREEEGTRS